MIFTLLAGILGAVLIAYLIIKFVPLKLKWLVSLVLLSIAGFLTYAIYQSVMAPIRFNEDKKVKYALVIENLRMIRDAEEAYKTVYGVYQDNPEKLIEFINTGQIAITNSRNILVQVNKGTVHQPIMVEIEQKVVDTTGYNSVKETIFKNRNYENMFNVPGTDKKFELNVGFLRKTGGLEVPVFEAKVDKQIILEGMDISLVKQEKESLAGDEVKGPYISVGSMEEVSANGNWPPYYDKIVK